MLNDAGMQRLFDGTFDATRSGSVAARAQNEKPAGIYVWACMRAGVLAGGMPLAFEKISTPLYRDVDRLRARRTTSAGDSLMRTWVSARRHHSKDICAASARVSPRSEPANEDAAALRRLSRPRESRRTVRDGRAIARRRHARHDDPQRGLYGGAGMSLRRGIRRQRFFGNSSDWLCRRRACRVACASGISPISQRSNGSRFGASFARRGSRSSSCAPASSSAAPRDIGESTATHRSGC